MWSHRVESLDRFTSHHRGFVVVSSRSRISHILQVSHRAHRLPAVRAYRLTAGGKIFHKRRTEDFTHWAVILLQSHARACAIKMLCRSFSRCLETCVHVTLTSNVSPRYIGMHVDTQPSVLRAHADIHRKHRVFPPPTCTWLLTHPQLTQTNTP